MRWCEMRVVVSVAACEAVAEKLRQLGAQGHRLEELGELCALTAYFPVDDRAGERSAELREFLDRFGDWGLDPGPAEIAVRPVDEADWRDQWRAFFHPVRVGRRLVVHPPWEPPGDELSAGDPVTIVIDPAQAFGTGTHATTRGALELLEVAAQGVELAADLGTGSGILAITAAKLGVGHIVGVDCDPVAVSAARENAARNGVAGRIELSEGDVFALVERWRKSVEDGAPMGTVFARRPELVMANITTDLIVALAGPVARLLPADGLFLCSGISTEEGAERVEAAAREAGLVEIDRRQAEGWTSFLFRLPAGAKVSKPKKIRARREQEAGGAPGAAPGAAASSAAASSGAATSALAAGCPVALFYTLGCKANLYDTAALMDDLARAGWEVRSGTLVEGAGNGIEDPVLGAVRLCVINSCAVTARAESKSRQLARRLRRRYPEALLALVGCYPQVRREEAAREAGVDIVLGTEDRHRLLDEIRTRGLGAGDAAGDVAPGHPLLPGAFAGERTRATLKVQDGCEQYCTYCVIPYARGPSRSRPVGEVLEEARRLVETGFREVVVTGIHLGAWGLDLRPAPAHLPALIEAIAALPGLARVRLSSIEPLEVSDELIELLATNPKICRHLHVPLQSGSNPVLERMNRHYRADEFLAMVDRVRSRVPLVGLTTDVMVGFPGETDADFAATLDLVRKARFSRLHAFRFSRRPGTPAADMPRQVEAGVKKARSEELTRLGRRLGREFRQGLVDRSLEVLVERVERGRAAGLTDNYVKVSLPVDRAGGVEPNDLVKVVLERVTADGMAGRPVNERAPAG